MPRTAQTDIDITSLESWFEKNVEDYKGPISLSKFAGGQSNPTYRVSTPNKDFVLRRKPAGELLKGAHAVDREARVMSALSKVGFPVPGVYGLCQDESVIGTWFFVMEMVKGRIFWDITLKEIPREERLAYFDAKNETLAALHNVDFQAIGLGDYGRQGGFLQRQIKLWTRQYQSMEEHVGRDPHMDKLIEWLPRNMPDADEVSIAHGDFRIDNMIFHPTEPKVIAVLDWELSTLGHPIVDFAYHLMMYRMPHGLRAGLKGLDLQELRLPSEQEYVKLYCARTGRNKVDHLDYYLAFNFFRFAAICHGIKARINLGTANDENAEKTAKQFPRLAKLAWEQVQLIGA